MIKKIEKSFDRGSKYYSKYSDFQKETASQLIEIIEPYQKKANHILDLGIGTGNLSLLSNFKNHQEIYGVDISFKMLTNIFEKNIMKVQADMHKIPFLSNSLDLVISNMVLHWSDNPSLAIKEINRILVQSGHFAASLVVQNSFYELIDSWSSVDDESHAVNFLSSSNINETINKNGFNIISDFVLKKTFYFSDFFSVANHFRKIGANINKIRKPGLYSRNKIFNLISNYEKLRTSHGLPLSYFIYFFLAKKDGSC